MEKIDLVESLIRFLAIKPLDCSKCTFEKAKEVIKADKKEAVSFIGEHGYFEELIETLARRIGDLGLKDGHMYLYVKGDSCKEKFKRNLLELVLNLKHIFIIGDAKDWPIQDPKIKFSQIEDQFTDNHQRFFVYQSPSFQAALVARHDENGRVEAAMTNDPEAVTFLAQILGSRVYKD